MIYYDKTKSKFVIDGMFFLVRKEHMPAIRWNEGDPFISVTNNVFITNDVGKVADAWAITRSLLSFLFSVWKNLVIRHDS